ncbi:MAG: UbiA prenyltransferase family protein [Polyangiales bacterium]
MFRDLIQLSRPTHWIKNVFVFLPVPFALASGAQLHLGTFALGLASFCLASSAVYGFNDAQDAERDRLHEDKRHRPIASGRISKPVAYVWSLLLASIGAGLAFATASSEVLLYFGLYLLVNGAYSLGAKHIALLDVFLLAGLYVLRALLGCALLGVQPSNWLLLCSYALALFLALAKRRADLVKGTGTEHRPALQGYNEGFLDQAIGISAGMTIIGYALYSMEAPVLLPTRKFAALPFVVFGVLDYLRLAHVQRAGGSPVDMLLRTPTLVIAGFGWLAATLWSLRWT